jgi:hypothetical protein
MNSVSGPFRRIVTLMRSRSGSYLAAIAIFWVFLTLDREPLARAIGSRTPSTLIIIGISDRGRVRRGTACYHCLDLAAPLDEGCP